MRWASLGFAALAAALAVLHGAARADGRLSQSYADCMEKSGGVTSAMQDCISVEFSEQNRWLNTVYAKLMASWPDKRKTALRDTQRKWIAFRDANCLLYDDGGSAGRLAANECSLRMTAQRLAELEDLKP